MMGRLVLFAAAVAISLPAQNATAPRLPDTAMRSRVLAGQIAHQPTDERIHTYERLLQSDPDNRQNEAGLIAAYLQKVRESSDFGYLDRAAKLVDRMLEKDGGNFLGLRYLNEIDLQRHDFKAVAERAETMIRDNPSDPGTWANLGDAAMELGEYDRAQKAYTRMFALRPGLGSYNRLAWWRFVTGDAETAIQLMRTAIEAGDDDAQNTAWCRAELGDIYFKIGRASEAADEYSAALALFPRLHRAAAGLARTEAYFGRTDAAINDYLRAQSVVPLVEYAAALEDLYTASGQANKAAEQRDLLATIETLGQATNEKTNRNLALILADRNRHLDLALRLIEAEVPARGDVYTYDALSWVLFKSGRVAEARNASAKALALHTPEPLFYYHASKIAAANGDVEASRGHSSKLASLNPKFDFGKTLVASAATR